jgi:hypothetical protein
MGPSPRPMSTKLKQNKGTVAGSCVSEYVSV